MKMTKITDYIIKVKSFCAYDVSETGIYLRLQVEPTQLGQIDRASLSPDTSYIITRLSHHRCYPHQMLWSICEFLTIQ
jgi:hypothetical protein